MPVGYAGDPIDAETAKAFASPGSDLFQQASRSLSDQFSKTTQRVVRASKSDGYTFRSLQDIDPPPNAALLHRNVMVSPNQVYATVRLEWSNETLWLLTETFLLKREPLQLPPWPDLHAAESLRLTLIEHKPECDNCLRADATNPPVDKTGWDHDILGDAYLKRCAPCDVPAFPWAHRLTAERLLEWLKANPDSYGPEFAEQIRKDCLGE